MVDLIAELIAGFILYEHFELVSVIGMVVGFCMWQFAEQLAAITSKLVRLVRSAI